MRRLGDGWAPLRRLGNGVGGASAPYSGTTRTAPLSALVTIEA